MSENSENLKLPYIMPSQAQKHVTHNEAVRMLDALVQLVLTTIGSQTPPANPAAGEAHFVGSNASDQWSGHDGKVAAFLDGAWQFFDANPGWLAYDMEGARTVVFDGSAWIDANSAPTELQNMSLLGVNSTADANNRLSVASAATLLNHEGAGHQLKLNKAAQTDTASMLFQSDWSGRAEMGLAGEDDFSLKVSNDGLNWATAMRADAQTGKVGFPNGSVTAKTDKFMGRWYAYTDARWVSYNAAYGPESPNINRNCGTGTEPTMSWLALGPLFTQGSTLKRLKFSMRTSNAQVSAVNLRVYFQYGPWGAGWANAASSTFDLVHSADNIALAGTGWSLHDDVLGDYECQQTGHLLIFLKPLGTITATRYIYSATAIEYES